MPDLIEALRNSNPEGPDTPTSEALEPTSLELRETHISWVLLGEKLVWKLKKPKELGFLDFRKLEQRAEACRAELELNRRLAPQTYLEVVPVVQRDGTYHFGGGNAETNSVVDWAVKMRRLPDACRADNLLSQGALTSEHLCQVATALARFHEQCARNEEISEFGAPAQILRNVQENFEQAHSLAVNYISPEQEAEIEAHQLEFLSQHDSLFKKRMQAGRVRDGHGDLRLEHIYFTGHQLQIIDCIEFNQRFRYADVCADLAFLFMDLNHNERSDLAESLLAHYAQQSGDYDLYQLVDFYEAYRAYVRAKVLSFLASDSTASSEAREHAGNEARRYYLHSLAAQRPQLSSPVVVAVSGIIGSGKSTAAGRISDMLKLPVVDSDRTRKQLLGKTVTEPLSADAYSREMTTRVYDEVFRRAGCVLDSGRGVILDTSFRTRASRRRALELAQSRNLPLLFVECHVPRNVALARLRERAQGPSISDGRAELYDQFAASFEPIDEVGPSQLLRLDTSLPEAEQLELLRTRLD